MKNNYVILISILLTAFAFGACSSVYKSGDPAPTAVSQESRNIATEENATYVTDLSFERDSASLDKESRRKLNDIVDRAQLKGQIEDIKVVAWSDSEYPSKRRGRLSNAEETLAERRGDNIKRYLQESDSRLDVDTFNMAKRPNSMAVLFDTKNARIKKSMETAGISHENNERGFPNKAGKSTVMVILRE